MDGCSVAGGVLPGLARDRDWRHDPGVRSLHDLAELRSLALHRAVARRLTEAPELIEAARRRVVDRMRAGITSPEYAGAWLRLLDGSREELVEAITDASERGAALRQTSPFSFVVPHRERWRIWREVRAQWEARDEASGSRAHHPSMR